MRKDSLNKSNDENENAVNQLTDFGDKVRKLIGNGTSYEQPEITKGFIISELNGDRQYQTYDVKFTIKTTIREFTREINHESTRIAAEQIISEITKEISDYYPNL